MLRAGTDRTEERSHRAPELLRTHTFTRKCAAVQDFCFCGASVPGMNRRASLKVVGCCYFWGASRATFPCWNRNTLGGRRTETSCGVWDRRHDLFAQVLQIPAVAFRRSTLAPERRTLIRSTLAQRPAVRSAGKRRLRTRRIFHPPRCDSAIFAGSAHTARNRPPLQG